MFAAIDGDIEGAIQSARANLAKLSLDLRAATYDADAAERAALGGANARGRVDRLPAAQPSRKSELAAEVEVALARAAQQIRAAEAEAEVLLASARADLLAAVLPTARRLDAKPGGRPRTNSPDAEHGPCEPSPPPVVSSRALVSPAVAAPPVFPLAVRTPTETPSTKPVTRRLAVPPALRAALARAAVRDRFFHADILLPLVAVLIVVIVLLAWVP